MDYKDFRDRMQGVIQYMSYWDPQAFEDFKFAALDQWNEDNKSKLREEKRAYLVLDKTRIIIDSVSGSEIVNRFEPKFYPRNLPGEDIDLEASEAIGETYKWTRQQSDVEHHESMMFRDMLICGVGCTDTYMDYTDNPDGRIVTGRVPIFQVSWDPTSQDANFADANFFVRDKWIPEKEFLVRYPEAKDVYKQSGDIRDTRLMQRLKERLSSSGGNDRYSGSRAFQFFDPSKNHVHVWELQYRDLEPVTRIMVPDAQGGFQEMTVKRDEEESALQEVSEMTQALRSEVEAMGGQIAEMSWQRYDRYNYKRAMIAGKEIIKESDEELNDFTLKFVTGFEDWSRGDKKYYFGLMKPMRDPQKYVNTFFSQAVHMWSTSPKGNLLYEPDFFENEEEALKNLAQPNQPTRVSHGALSNTAKDKFHILDNNRSFAGTEPLFHFANSAIPDASGVNPAYGAGLATDVRRAAASAISLVQQQNLATLGPVFDNLKRYRKAHAKLVLGFVRNYMPEEQVMRILGPNKANLVSLTKDDLIREYDIVVGEGPESPNKQHEVLAKLTETGMLTELLGMQLWPAEGWKYLGFPGDLGMQIMQRQQQVEQMMQQQAQAAPVEEAIQ